MTQLFGIPIDTLSIILLTIACIIVGGVLLLALGNKIFFKIGVRNIPRRRTQMLLIVFALMLSTTLLSSVLTTGDVMTSAVQSVAVYNLGNVDELIEGGRSPIGLYPDFIYYRIADRARRDPNSTIAAVSAALREQNLLIADETSRQVRSQVTGLGVIPGTEGGFGGMQNVVSKRKMTIAALRPDEVYLNQTLAQLLNAKAGDTLYLYSQRWQGKRYVMRVAGVVNNAGLVGDNSFLLARPDYFRRAEGDPDGISQIFIANRGGGGLSGVGLSDSVADTLHDWIPGFVHVIQVKQQGVQVSQNAEDIFSRIFALFTLFALAIGLLLIFLIFVLLAAERRAEMGMARAIGVQRRHLILMFLFEGAVYDLLASIVGLLFGILAGIALVQLLGPVLQRFNFPLKLTFQPHSMIIAYCLGVIFTFCSVAISSWLVSRMTVVEAMRDQPEPGRSTVTLREMLARLFQLLHQGSSAYAQRNMRRARRVFFEMIPDILVGIVAMLVRLGLLPLLAGLWLLQYGLNNTEILPFSLGFSLLVVGGALLIKALLEGLFTLVAWLRSREQPQDRSRMLPGLFAAVVGLALLAYWALPFDVLGYLGLPRFQGGIEIFFIAGVMMVLGTAWAIIANARLLASPLLALCAGLPGLYAMARLALAYPLHRRFRTGLSVVMFSLVVFAMTIMAVITSAMQNTYVNIDAQTGGYDIQATAYFKPLPDLRTSLVQHGINPNAFSAIGVRTSTAVGVIQPAASAPRWSLYPAQLVSGGFLQGYGLHLTARAQGFSSDSAVWHALQTHPNYALIDSSALAANPDTNGSVYDPNSSQAANANVPATPPGIDPSIAFALSGVYQSATSFPAVPIWVVGTQLQQSMKLTIIGVVDNSDGAHFGLYIQPGAASLASIGTGIDKTQPETQTYYFKVAPGQDPRALSLALGSAYLDNGLETTVLADAIWQVRGPRILLSNVLLGVVGMTLLLGIAALAITGTRAVVERRQQIGMLRALGCGRHLIQGAFLLESFLVGALGSILGIVLGLILASNVFAANFFEQYQTGLTFSIPWQQLGIIVGVAFLASLLGALLPAWQAGRIAPAEALR
nr:FtsX-like permease family protein [Chloroflexota bacterium]